MNGRAQGAPARCGHETMTALQAEGGRPQDSTDAEIIDAELVAQLSTAIEAAEAVDWRSVPRISAVTAATFTRQLIEARQRARRGHYA